MAPAGMRIVGPRSTTRTQAPSGRRASGFDRTSGRSNSTVTADETCITSGGGSGAVEVVAQPMATDATSTRAAARVGRGMGAGSYERRVSVSFGSRPGSAAVGTNTI